MRRLRIGVGPVATTEAGRAACGRAALALSRVIGRATELEATASYAELLRGLARAELDVAWLPPLLCVRAIEAGATLLVGAVRGEGKLYHGTIFVRPDSSRHAPADLRGATIAWVDHESCGGYLFPRLALGDAGLELSGLFAREMVCGSHAAVVDAVASGAVDCGATYLELHDGVASTAGWTRTAHGPMRSVLVSSPIPSDAFCASNAVDRETRDRVGGALSELHRDPAGAAVLAELFQATRFEPALPRHYDVVRRAITASETGAPISSTRFR